MKSQLVLIITLIILSFSANASNVSTEQLIKEAAVEYDKKCYDNVIEIYNDLIAQGFESTDIYYNLGNAYYSKGDLGNANVSYLKALKLDPSNDKAENNLKYIVSKVDDKNRLEVKDKKINISADEPSFLENVYNILFINTHSDVWAVIGITFFILLIIGVVLYIFINNVVIKKIGFFGAITCLIIVIIANVFAFIAKNEYYSESKAVVTNYSINLRNEAKDNANIITTPLHSGTILDVVDRHVDINDESWVKLRLNSEIIGWVKLNEIKTI